MTNGQNRPSQQKGAQLTEKEGWKVACGDKNTDLISYPFQLQEEGVAFAAGCPVLQKSLFFFWLELSSPPSCSLPSCMGALLRELEGSHSCPRLQRECRLCVVKSASVWWAENPRQEQRRLLSVTGFSFLYPRLVNDDLQQNHSLCSQMVLVFLKQDLCSPNWPWTYYPVSTS